jgi:type IV secretory pathway TraG/TraD family ATPase VirD4
VLAPTLVGWGPGPVVVTSTKPDVLETWGVREAEGVNTLFDPTGSVGRPDLCVGWSPLARCEWWDDAVHCAAVMLHPQALDTSSLNARHFADMAKQLLAPLLHAAALARRPIADARSWLLSAEFSEPLEILDQHNAANAADELRGVAMLPFGEHQGGILATAATALGWVVRDSVRAATDPERSDQLDIDAFLDRGGTLYIVSPSRTMQELAPLNAALVDAIAERALERAVAQRGRLEPRLLLALDEAANIAPLASLPSLVAEGGQQGVTSVVVLQDISQAYERWGRDGAHTLWNNATLRVVLPGVADPATVDLVTKFAGEIERWVRSVSNQWSEGWTSGEHGGRNRSNSRSESWSSRIEPLSRGGEVQRLPRSEGLLLARSLPPARLVLQPELPSAGPPVPPDLGLSAAAATREALRTAKPDLEVSEQLSGVGAPAPG